jgi:general secretion pathway protein J
MKRRTAIRPGGFTLIEVLAALLILSALALMSYRGLSAVLDAREHVTKETNRWRRVAAFFSRFERDIGMAAPRPVRSLSGSTAAPAWRGTSDPQQEPRVEFSRFASVEGMDTPRRVAYSLNARQEVELWLWPALDVAPDTLPARYTVLAGVTDFELQYLDANSVWVNAWPGSATDPPLPRAVRLRIILATGEELMRLFALNS